MIDVIPTLFSVKLLVLFCPFTGTFGEDLGQILEISES